MRAEAAAETRLRQHRRPNHQRTGAEAEAAAGRALREAVPTYDKFSGRYCSSAAAVRYDSMRRLSRRPVCFQWGRVCWWHFQRRVGIPYAHSGLAC